MKKILQRILLVVLSIIFVFILGETFSRLLNAPSLELNFNLIHFSCFQKGTYYWFSIKPNCSETNSFGFRGPKFSKEKPDNKQRIIVVGDSFPYGVGVDQTKTFPSLLATTLPNVEIINAGVIATEPGFYYLYMKNDGLRLNPDLVIVVFYPENDIYDFDNQFNLGWSAIDSFGLPEKITSDSTYVDTSGYLVPNAYALIQNPTIQHSRLLSYLSTRYLRLTKKSFQISRTCLYKANCRDLDEQKDNIKKLFLGMRKLTQDRAVKFLVVMVPSEFQIYPEKRLKFNIYTPLSPDELNIPQNEFAEFFQENDIDYLDLLPTFRAHIAEKTYLSSDTHWNEKGHKIAAEAIQERL